MYLGRMALFSDASDLFAPFPSLLWDRLYGQQRHTLHHIPLQQTRFLGAFFYHPFTQLRRHLLHITEIHVELLGNLFVGQIQAHEIQTQHPHFQRLMMSSKNGVGQIIKALVTVVTLIALTGQCRVIKAALHDLLGLTRGTRDAVWPAQCAYGLITLHIIDQILNIDLQRWTPVRVWDMGCPQCTPSSNSTTLESNM